MSAIMTGTDAIYSYLNGAKPTEPVQVKLLGEELWTKFYNAGTEMIITKGGRRMFPTARMEIKGLDPLAYYCVFLKFVPSTGYRYKYSSSNGWAPAGPEEAHSPHRTYAHSDGARMGTHWMSQHISFGKLKLTNTIVPPEDQVVLSSMHKYQPVLVISRCDETKAAPWAPTVTVVFPKMQFIAVTAYQNSAVTQLKIDNNPFAKGFREAGQSKSKRKKARVSEPPKKRTRLEARYRARLRSADETRSLSSTPSSRCSDFSDYPSPLALNTYYPTSSPTYQQQAGGSAHQYNHNPYCFYPHYPCVCYYSSPQYSMVLPFYHRNDPYFYHRSPSNSSSPSSTVTSSSPNNNPVNRNFTDFSIRAIVGSKEKTA